MPGELITNAARAVAGGAMQGARRALTLDDVAVLDQLVADLPAARQLAIGRQLLDDPRVHSTPAVRGPLAAIRSGIAPVETPDVAGATILAQVRQGLDQEIGRIDGTVPTTGYEGHPDYGVVGSIRDNLHVLAALQVI